MSHQLLDPDFYRIAFETAAGFSKDGFIIVDKSGTIIEINEAYARFLDVDRKEAIDQYCEDVIPITEMVNIMRENRVDIENLRVHNIFDSRKDRTVIVSRAPFRDSKGEIIGAVAQVKFRDQIAKEVSRLNHFYTELNLTPEAVYQAAQNRLAIYEQNKVLPSEYDRMMLYLEYCREELTKSQEKTSISVIGKSKKFLEIKTLALQAAKTSFSVLITGETGTGKEILANLIHTSSSRKDAPFVKLNCAAIPSELLESELFGYADGAFTGARKGGRKGKFEIANKGSIFLDEIGDMPLNMQAKLLRVLQEQEIEPVGSNAPIPIDVRVISATRRNLKEMISRGEFREDLYYRLNEIHIHAPTLNERAEDIELLANYFLEEINEKYNSHITIAPEAMEILKEYHWPGNIRELNNVIKSAYSIVEDEIRPENLPNHMGNIGGKRPKYRPGITLHDLTEEFEKGIILHVLRKEGYNVSKAAEVLGVYRSNFYKKLEKYKIDVEYLKKTGNSNHKESKV